jgi:hypothetical protein
MRFLTVHLVLQLVGFCALLLARAGFRKDGVRFFASGLFWKTMTPFGATVYAAGWILLVGPFVL